MSVVKNRKIVILYADKRTVFHYLAQAPAPSTREWMYLGKNVELCLEIEKHAGTHIKRVDISQSLQKIAKQTRQEYIDYIGQICPENPPVTWWLRLLSEKNPRISNFFLNVCYLQVVRDYLSTSQNELLLVCESRGLIRAIVKNFPTGGNFSVEVADPISMQMICGCRDIIKSSLTFGYFLLRWNIRCLFAHIYRVRSKEKLSGLKDKNFSLIHSWVDDRSFSHRGTYTDVYLGTLAEKMQADSEEVYYLADVLPTLFYPTALKKMRDTKKSFLLMEEFLHPFEIISAAIIGRFGLPKLSKIPRFQELNVDELVKEDLRGDALDMRASQNYLSYYIGKRIGLKFSLNVFIYSFENLMWEKMFCKSIHDGSPKTRIIGYAHSVVDPMYTFYSVSSHEKSDMPLPDRIIVNGNHAKKILSESGFSKDIIFISGALRYPNIQKNLESRMQTDASKTILIATAAGIQETIEVIEKTITIFGDQKNIRCIVKIHPTIPQKMIERTLKLPSNFSMSNASPYTLFASSDLMIYTSSAVSIEAMSWGLKILHMKSDFTIDMNIFEGYNLVRSVSSGKELYTTAMDIINDPPLPKEVRDSIVKDFFAPVDDKVINEVIHR